MLKILGRSKKATGMKKFLFNIFILLFSATAVLSCTVAMDMSMREEEMADMVLSITVTGTTSDVDTNKPIKGIRLTMYALETGNYESLFTSETVYTDDSGKFVIKMSGFRNPASFTIKAEDPAGTYEASKHEIPLVTWDSSYSFSHGTFYVNGCDFHMKKK